MIAQWMTVAGVYVPLYLAVSGYGTCVQQTATSTFPCLPAQAPSGCDANAWLLLTMNGKAKALRAKIETSARSHGFGRILRLLLRPDAAIRVSAN